MCEEIDLFNFSHLDIPLILYHHGLASPCPSNLLSLHERVLGSVLSLTPCALGISLTQYGPRPATMEETWFPLQSLFSRVCPCTSFMQKAWGHFSVHARQACAHVWVCVPAVYLSRLQRAWPSAFWCLFCSLDLPEWWQGPSRAGAPVLTETGQGRSGLACAQWARSEEWDKTL